MGSVLLAVWMSALTGTAGPIAEGDRHQQNLDYDLAVVAYKKALREPGTRAERLHALTGLGMSQAFVGDLKGAKATFERLLLVDPRAKLPAGAGPKAQRPFELARRSVGEKQNQVTLERDPESGVVRALLREDVPLAAEVRLHARAVGESEYRTDSGSFRTPAQVALDPAKGAEAWAEALDESRGVLYMVGHPLRPKGLEPVVRALQKMDTAFHQAPSDAELAVPSSASGPRRWPIVVGVGAVVLVAGGVTAAILASQPPGLKLPDSDRTVHLP